MKRNSTICYLLAFLLNAGITASAEDAKPGADPVFAGVTLEAYLERALSENPELRQFEHRYEAATHRVPQMSSLPDPMLQVTHFVESVQTRTGPQENLLVLNQRLPWFGKLKNREAAANAEAEALWFSYQNRQLKLVEQVSLAFYEYGYLENALHLTGENLELLKSLEPVVETRVKAGGNLNSLLLLKVEIGKMEDRLQSLLQKRITQSADLLSLLALPDVGVLPWPSWEKPEPMLLNFEELQQDLIQENPALNMLKRKVASAEARKAVADLERYPDFTLGVNYVQIGDPDVNPTAAGAGEDAWGITAGISIPLWPGKIKAGRQEAVENINASEQELEQKRNQLNAQLKTALALHADAERRLNLYGEELLDLAQQAVDNSFRSYEVGAIGILEVIDSERSLLELQLLYWRAAADACQQRIRIQSLVNRPLSGEK
jgi:outer membrane protein, heavy metal efflux system